MVYVRLRVLWLVVLPFRNGNHHVGNFFAVKRAKVVVMRHFIDQKAKKLNKDKRKWKSISGFVPCRVDSVTSIAFSFRWLLNSAFCVS